ncbi:hypothetical protein BH11MYX2_BH11MYX2_18020 [soil metagenome]
MRIWRRAHVAALVAIGALGAGAIAQPADPFAPLAPPPGQGGGSGEPTSAGTSPVESNDVPADRPSPPRFAVAPFENRSNVRAFDWMTAGAPFEIAEKTESVLGLESAGGPLYVGPAPVLEEAAAVAGFAQLHEATWVVTGWVERPNWERRMGIAVWKVDNGLARRMHEAVRQGPLPTYHALLGGALAESWGAVGMKLDETQQIQLARTLATDLYAVNLMGRGLGHLVAANGITTTDPAAITARTNQLKLAQHDLERATLIDPKCYEAQRLVGELYLAQLAAGGEPKLAGKAAGKFAYANDLEPDDIQSLRAASRAAIQCGRAEVALPLVEKLVTARPWDLDARFQYGAALWQTGAAERAELQFAQVTARQPDNLPARRVLVLIHSARNETEKLVCELEAIASRAPTDLDVKADLASAYGALGHWDRATQQLEAIAAARPPDLALLVRIGDNYRRSGKLDDALAWYGRAAKQNPDSSMPGFLAAQALFEAGKLDDAAHAYTLLQKYAADRATAEHALGVIAYRRGVTGQAAWNLRKATQDNPRELRTWRALVASELARKDAVTSRADLDRALVYWPTDQHLRYLSGVTAAFAGDAKLAHRELTAALVGAQAVSSARLALSTLDAGGTVVLDYQPDLIRPWGDAEAVQGMLDRFTGLQTAMATLRLAYQTQFLTALGALRHGPYAPGKNANVRVCPVSVVAPAWQLAQKALRAYERQGVYLEATYEYLQRHADAGAAGALLPNARTGLTNAKKTFRTSLADISELRAEWVRGLGPELRTAGCNDKLLAAAIANPDAYRAASPEAPPEPPASLPPRPKARATFYVDNVQCPDAVDVWVDGAQVGQVSPGRRSALVADAGQHTMCLLMPGSAQCGDKSTNRQIYLHDGWSVTMHCPR